MVQLTRENFDEEVTEAAGRVLVDFWGPGCGPCRVVSVPTLLLFRDGVPVGEIVGAVPASRVEKLLAAA